MAELIINPLKIKKETGLDFFEDFLFPKLQLASWKMHGPFLVKAGGKTYAVGRMHEKGYFQGMVLPNKLEPKYFKPYFLFEPDGMEVFNDLTEAVVSLASGEKLSIDYDIPYSFYEAIKDADGIEFLADPPKVEGSITRILTEQVESLLKPDSSDIDIALNIVDGLKTDKKHILKEYLNKETKDRFKLLDGYMEEYGLSALVVTASLNLQEVAAVPQRNNFGGTIAIYIAGSKDVIVVNTNEVGLLRSGRAGVLDIPGLAELLPDGKIGIDDEDIGMGVYYGLGLDKREVVPASVLLRDWREERAGGDLPFYIITGCASRRSIERSLAEAARRIDNNFPVNEKDIYEFYNINLNEFLTEYKAPYTFEVYFANLHSGNRSESPSNHKDYEVKPENNTVKFDSGIKLYDNWGYLRGVSDVARTLCFSEKAQEIYELFDRIMLDQGIPAAKIGATGEDVYMATCEEINKNREYIAQRGYIPSHVIKLEEIYSRDVGHLLGKEEPANLCFKKGEKKAFKDGMVGCYEIQWGYKDHSFGTEDSFVVTREGAINFTR